MSKKRDNEYFFTFENDDSEPQFEDITSSSATDNFEDIYSLSDFTGKGNYQKRKRGIAKWLYSLKKWWISLKKSHKAVIISFLSVVLIFSILLGVIFTQFDYNYKKINTEDLGFENVIDKNIVNVALFGIDTRDVKSFEGNSDSIMILSLNTVTKKVKIISVMRDTLVPITYNGKTTYSKINSAYAKGGPELAIKTLNQVFGLDISEYATVNFFGMVDIIDAVGGIEAELTEGEVQSRTKFRFGLNGCIAEICAQTGDRAKTNYIFTPGKHHLNGIQAVAYSRIRKVQNIWGTNNDFGRTDRQRYVMEQLFNKAITLEKKSYVKLAKSLIPCSETSLSYSEIMGLAFDILLKSPTFEQSRVPMDDYIMPSPNTSAGSVVYFDLDYAAKLIHAFIYDDITPDAYIEANGVEKNDWYRDKFGYYTPSTSSSEPDDYTSSEPQTSSEPDDTSSSNPSESEPDDTSSDTSSDGDEPSEPENPSEPTEPSNPENPSEPTEPSDPSTPSEPENPSTPNTPPASEPSGTGGDGSGSSSQPA